MSCKKDCIYYESCPHVEMPKMTNEAAHFYLEDFQREITNHRQAYSDEFIQSHGKALEALEKQIPKKPLARADRMQCCPNCLNALARDFEKGFPHCMECGQAIDWSEMP